MPDALVDEFETIDLARIERFVAEQEPETETLDFKEIRKSPAITEDDKKGWSRLLGAFANASGGLVVFGVEAKKPAGARADCAQSLRALSDPSQVESQLRSLVSRATIPPVQDVQLKTILESEGNSGYVVAVVPRSETPPHRSIHGRNQYYRRTADSNREMSHDELADMFGRRPRPKLVPVIRFGVFKSKGFYAAFGVKNVGAGIARFPAIRVSVGPPPFVISQYGIDGNRNFGLRRIPKGRGIEGDDFFGGGADDVAYPGEERLVGEIKPEGHVVTESLPELVVIATVFADGMSPNREVIKKDVRPTRD